MALIIKPWIFALSGASGQIIGVRVLRHLVLHAPVRLIASAGALTILKDEHDIDWMDEQGRLSQEKVRSTLNTLNITCHDVNDLSAPPSSGSSPSSGMFIVPCSMKTLAGIAHGYADNLIQRAADVTLKESRPLLLSPREMPFSALHLENMLKLARLGVIIAPPVPAWYHRPADLDAMVDFHAGKILDAMAIPHNLFTRWGESSSDV